MANRSELQGTNFHKGIARVIRANKRMEADVRNSVSAPDRRRAFWRERGFTRQSHARQVIYGTVADINAQAITHKQRAEDWPLAHPIMQDVTHSGVTG
jgi:hypothetical protein